MKHKKILSIIIIGTILAVYGRWAQLFLFTESETGFFYVDTKYIAYGLSALIAVAIIIATVFSTFTHRCPKGAPKNTYVSIALAVFDAALLYEGIFVTYPANLFLLGLTTRVFAILSAIVVFIFIFTKKDSIAYRPLQIGLSCPIIFTILKTLTYFVITSRLSATANVTFYLLFLCSFIVFLLFFARMESDISISKTSYLLFPISVVTTMLGAVCSLPLFGALLVGKSAVVMGDMSNTVLALAGAVLAFTYVTSLYDVHNIKLSHSHSHSLEMDMSSDDFANEFYHG